MSFEKGKGENIGGRNHVFYTFRGFTNDCYQPGVVILSLSKKSESAVEKTV